MKGLHSPQVREKFSPCAFFFFIEAYLCQLMARLHPLEDRQDKNRSPLFLFPGSFRPWHEGHREFLRQLPEKAEVVIIPDYNPQKIWHEQDNHPLLFYFSLCRRLQQERKTHFSHIHYSIYPGHLGKKEACPTAKWIFPLSKTLQRPLILLMGEDSFRQLSSWYRPDLVLQSLKELWVLPRGEGLNIKEKTNLLGVPVVYLQPHPYEHLSSSTIREHG